MTPHFIPIYGSSIVAICMLALFASHNRKTGWTKQRGKVSQWLDAFYEGAYTDSSATRSAFREPAQPAIPSWTPLTDAEVDGFSQQLIRLRGSLGASGMAPAYETQRVAREAVHQ